MLPRLWTYETYGPLTEELEGMLRAANELGAPNGHAMGRASTAATAAGYTAPLDIFEHDDRFECWLDVPGIAREDLKISLENDTVRVQGERPAHAVTEAASRHFRSVERWSGSFSRSFTIPQTVDATRIEAKVAEGVLKVVLPKRDQAKPRQIPVTG